MCPKNRNFGNCKTKICINTILHNRQLLLLKYVFQAIIVSKSSKFYKQLFQLLTKLTVPQYNKQQLCDMKRLTSLQIESLPGGGQTSRPLHCPIVKSTTDCIRDCVIMHPADTKNRRAPYALNFLVSVYCRMYNVVRKMSQIPRNIMGKSLKLYHIQLKLTPLYYLYLILT